VATSIEAITTAAVSLALQAASLRQQAIGANIANANAAGYAPMQLSFETQLAEAREALRAQGRVTPAMLEMLQPELVPALDAHGRPAPIQVDAQMAEMAANAVHYQALVQGLSRHMSIMATAAADGRR